MHARCNVLILGASYGSLLAAKLLLAISTRIVERLRDVTDKVRLYSDLVQVMQQEIDRLMPTPDRRRDGAAPPASLRG